MSATIQADTIIGQKYRIGVKIGSGSFGEIYSGTLISDEPGPPPQVAIKFEKKAARCPQLRHEFKVYRELQGCSGIGRVMYFGSYRDCNVMVMELLGPSLEDLFNTCGRRFSLRTTLQIADQLLERAETLHENHLIHRDIKPANFVANLQVQTSNALVFCIDFGLSKRYRHPHTMQHIPYREGRSLTGTPRYASVANHQGVETSRRDDLESIGYILVYFLLGKLPWQGLKLPPNVSGTASQKHRLILDKKQLTPLAELCRGCPPEFQEYLAYCRELAFDAKPNTRYVRNLFRELFRKQGYHGGPVEWDWIKPVGDPKPALGAGAGVGRPPLAAKAAKAADEADKDAKQYADRLYAERQAAAAPRAAYAAAQQPSSRSHKSGAAGDKVTVTIPSGRPSTAANESVAAVASTTYARLWTAQTAATASTPADRAGAHSQVTADVAAAAGANHARRVSISGVAPPAHEEPRSAYDGAASGAAAARARPQTAPGGGYANVAAMLAAQQQPPPVVPEPQPQPTTKSFWRSADEQRGNAAAPQSRASPPGTQAWSEGPRRPKLVQTGKEHAGYVMDDGPAPRYGAAARPSTGEARAAPQQQLHYGGQSHLVAGSLSLVRHRRESTREQRPPASQPSARSHGALHAQYPSAGGGLWQPQPQPPQQAPPQPTAAQAAAAQQQRVDRHTAWNAAASAAARSKTPMRPTSAVRANSARGKQIAAPPRAAQPSSRNPPYNRY